MAKIKLTKNELKIQRDSLKRFERYLPTLQLKKQQLQLEIRQLRETASKLENQMAAMEASWNDFLPLMSGTDAIGTDSLVIVQEWHVSTRNVAGIDVPVFGKLVFAPATYDLYATPPWFDDAAEMVKSMVELSLRRQLMDETLALIEQELRIVTQRVNLFEKVKIPEARENIRKINISIGDQQTNSVGRSKIAKGKCAARDAATVL